MKKLVDLIGTQYLTFDFKDDLTTILRENKELDLAGACIAIDCMNELMGFLDRGAVYCIDTLDPIRNDILAENRKRQAIDAKEITFPLLRDVRDIGEYIKGFSEGYLYRIIDRPEVFVPLTCLVSMIRPEISIDPDKYTKQLFEYIYRNVLPGTKDWDELYMVSGATYRKIVIKDGKVTLPFKGGMSYNELISSELVIPAEFGTRVLVDDPEWQLLFNQAIYDVQAVINPKLPKIKDFL